MKGRLYYDHVLIHPRENDRYRGDIVIPGEATDATHGEDMELIRKNNSLCLGEVVAISPELPNIVIAKVGKRDGEDVYDHVRRLGTHQPDCEVGELVMYQRAGGARARLLASDLVALGIPQWEGKELVLVREEHIYCAVTGDVVQELGGIRSAS